MHVYLAFARSFFFLVTDEKRRFTTAAAWLFPNSFFLLWTSRPSGEMHKNGALGGEALVRAVVAGISRLRRLDLRKK